MCDTKDTLNAGATWSLPFTLRIDKVIPDSSGTISLYGPPQYGRGQWTGDTNTANDTAKIVINPTGGGSGSGGGLPVTGTKTGLIAASGIALLAVGVGLRILARRRRVAPDTQG